MEITSTVTWTGETSANGAYSRRHHWQFDGGAEIAASSAPGIVPLPWSDPACIDPEEAVLAALSSCHMLFFLHLACDAGFTVHHYADTACARLVRDRDGRLSIGEITLSPTVRMAEPPGEDVLARLHDEAHARCFIAASLKAPVTICPAPATGGLTL
ncbi:MAG: OsmC family protein [Rhodobacteraceae bacterium]|jgi:organic hydroperoxide reductase OsmC/OhrA|nr:OsmC family protein [Paracoccaceae bacterium]MBL4558050.1 OsmC family protein [Paracoccaceae bacterium]HBG98953.1 peroxiredoxin [Paracoccaceae bacterium]